jgi:hypothetical protein
LTEGKNGDERGLIHAEGDKRHAVDRVNEVLQACRGHALPQPGIRRRIRLDGRRILAGCGILMHSKVKINQYKSK